MAAGVSDGAIIIDTKLDNSGFMRDAKRFKGAVNGLKTAVNDAGQQMAQGANAYAQAMAKSNGQTRAAQAELKRLEAQAEKLKKAMSGDKIYTDAYKQIRSDIEKTEQEIAGLQAKQQEWADMGMSPESNAFEQVDEQIMRLIDHVDELNAKQNEMLASGTAYTSEYAQAQQEYEGVTGRISELTSAMEGVSGSEEAATKNAGRLYIAMMKISTAYLSAGGGIRGAFAGIASAAGQALGALGKFAGHAAIGFLKKLAAGAKNAAIQRAKLAGSAIKSGIKKLGSAIGGAVKSLFGLNKATGSANDGLKRGFMTILRYGLGIRGLFALFRKLRGAIKEGFEEMSKSNPRVKASLDGLKASLNGLKGSLATAFAPILTAVAPALTTLINILTTAINTVGAFFAALTGQSSYNAAVGGLDAVGGAAGGAAGKVKELKRQLAGFDQLNVLGKNDSSGGSGSGLSYETQEIGSGITDFVAKLKEMWSAADFDGIGRLIADGINGAFAKAKQLISWDNLGGKITEAVNAITGIFNGLVSGIDWDNIGRTFGTGINTILKTVNLLADGVEWANLGKSLANGLSGLVDEVDWTELGRALGQKFRIVFQLVGNFLQEFDWQNLGSKLAEGLNSLIKTIGDAITGIDWAKIGKNFGAGLTNLFTQFDWNGLGKTIAGYINAALDVILNALKNFDFIAAGKQLGEGFSTLVTSVDWANVGKIISDAVIGALDFISAAIDGVDWEQLGKDLFEMLKSIDWVGLAKSLFNLIGKALAGLGKLLYGIFEAAVDEVKKIDWAGIGSYLWEKIKGAFGSIGQWFKDKFNEAVAAIKAINWKNVGLTILTLVKNGFGAIGQWFKDKFNNAVAAIKGINWQAAGEFMKTKISYGIGSAKQWLKDKFDAAREAIGKINWKEVGESIWTAIKNGIGDIKQWFKDKFKGAVNAVIDLLNTMIGKAESGVNKIINGINKNLTIDFTVFGKRVYASPDIPEASFGRIKKLATGGILKDATLFGALGGKGLVGGEAGKEAVLPLERNTSWMDMIAERVWNYHAPAMASGSVMPYDVSAQIARSTEEIKGTLDANNEDLIQAIISAVGSQTSAIVAALARMNTGGAGLSAQQVVAAINQQTLMFGASPLRGV